MFNTIVQDGDPSLNNITDGDGFLEIVNYSGAYPAYTGAVEVTPNESTQTLNTAFKTVTENIVINPIPETYASIELDGNTLKVE